MTFIRRAEKYKSKLRHAVINIERRPEVFGRKCHLQRFIWNRKKMPKKRKRSFYCYSKDDRYYCLYAFAHKYTYVCNDYLVKLLFFRFILASSFCNFIEIHYPSPIDYFIFGRRCFRGQNRPPRVEPKDWGNFFFLNETYRTKKTPLFAAIKVWEENSKNPNRVLKNCHLLQLKASYQKNGFF